MGNFHEYSLKMDEIAKTVFGEYEKAAAALKAAEAEAREYPERRGMAATAEYHARSARAKADLLTAQKNLKAWKKVAENRRGEIEKLRSELETAISDHYAANPEKINPAAMELLRSGIMKTGEFRKLMDQAQSDENYTMVRLIGKFASDAAVERAKKYGEDDSTARELRAIGYMSNQHDGNDVLQSFDYLVEVYDRSVDNPAMMQDWTDLTAATIEAM